MELLLGNSIRVVVAGGVRPRSRYGVKPDGTRGPVGVETDPVTGAPLVAVTVTLIGGPAGYAEGVLVVAPEPVLVALPPAGTLVELTGELRQRIAGGDYGTVRSTVTGVVGVRPLGSVVDALNAVGVQPVSVPAARGDRSAS